MGALTDSLTAVSDALTAAGVTNIIKQVSTSAPPSTAYAVLTAKASSLSREDVGNFGGMVEVTAEWYSPGAKSDGETAFLAAMDAWDLIVSRLCSMDATCQEVDPGEVEQEPESADIAYWYTATAVCSFMRKEPAS